ncbi:MAG TPA: hypothetical protein DCS28_02665 [Candidatus Moranbacteria bacterium]|nr:hypothetical protein [Candidatus Moranbacteria bacterium]HAT74918.1 hypothetical protein [Candidatus Moranbacteria bacterium]
MRKTDIANKKIKPQTVVFGLLIFLIFYLAIIMISVYGFDADNKLTKKTVRFVPLPAATWGTNFISVSRLKMELGSVKMFYENQDFSDLGMRVDFTTADGKKRLKIKEKNILNKLIENKLIENEATKRGLAINPEDISQEVSRKMQEYGSEEYLKDNLAKLYGWRLSDFEENIVKPDMYKEKLFANLLETDKKSFEAKDKISAALNELNNGKSFEETAEKYSDGESAQDGGKLGWFRSNQMLPEIVETVFALKKGERSKIIESSLGYHIIEMEDRDIENNEDIVQIKQIFVRSLDFSEWLAEYEKNFDIHIFLKDFYWNKDAGTVEFKNDDLKNFEENLDKNSPDDISILF